MNKKEYLDYLYYKMGNQNNDFWIWTMKKEGEEIKTSKWITYSELCFSLNPEEFWKVNWINNRTILPNEIVLDYDTDVDYMGIISRLKDIGIKFRVFKTGSRGFHIHLLFKNEVQEEDKESFIKLFGAEEGKGGKKVGIALEFCPHWKTEIPKTLIYEERGINNEL